jgi:uncharacterized membrane protein YkoI
MLVIAGLLLRPAAVPRAEEDDHDLARRALEAGETVPLDQILQQVQQRYAGTVVELELERKERRWVYEVELIAPDGRLLRLWLDAKSGELLNEEGG